MGEKDETGMSELLVAATRVVLPDRVLHPGWVWVRNGRIVAVGAGQRPRAAEVLDATGYTLAPGLVDIHVHGGAGADFMDGTEDAILRVCDAHLRHGTTSLVFTTTSAPRPKLRAVLQCARRWLREAAGSRARPTARLLGVHLYGPFFGPEAVGCHSAAFLEQPDEAVLREFFDFAHVLLGVTVAPEVPGWERIAREANRLGLRIHVGHSNATFQQFQAAVELGASHVDHLYCAMSDKSKLRRRQPYPMQGGVLEGTLFFDHVTTELIADGKHLAPELLALAFKLKGPQRLALVTDCNRALDMPDGEYVFGPQDCGPVFIKRDGVGQMPDGSGLASSCVPLLHCARVFRAATGCSLPELFQVAALTPARIVGCSAEVGSIEPGKRADLVVVDDDLQLHGLLLGGIPLRLP